MNRCASRALSTTVLATALVLGGCGQGSDTTNDPAKSPSAGGPSNSAGPSNPDPSSSAVDTPSGQVTGKNGSYSVATPADWREATDEVGKNAFGLDLVLVSSKQVGKFSDNLVVLVSTGDETAVKAELEKGRAKLAESSRKVTGVENVPIAGAIAMGFTGTYEQEGIAITARSYALAHDGKVYLLTLSSSMTNQKAALTAFGQIASSWQWK